MTSEDALTRLANAFMVTEEISPSDIVALLQRKNSYLWTLLKTRLSQILEEGALRELARSWSVERPAPAKLKERVIGSLESATKGTLATLVAYMCTVRMAELVAGRVPGLDSRLQGLIKLEATLAAANASVLATLDSIIPVEKSLRDLYARAGQQPNQAQPPEQR
jgi:hypothetical protein